MKAWMATAVVVACLVPGAAVAEGVADEVIDQMVEEMMKNMPLTPRWYKEIMPGFGPVAFIGLSVLFILVALIQTVKDLAAL